MQWSRKRSEDVRWAPQAVIFCKSTLSFGEHMQSFYNSAAWPIQVKEGRNERRGYGMAALLAYSFNRFAGCFESRFLPTGRLTSGPAGLTRKEEGNYYF